MIDAVMGYIGVALGLTWIVIFLDLMLDIDLIGPVADLFKRARK